MNAHAVTRRGPGGAGERSQPSSRDDDTAVQSGNGSTGDRYGAAVVRGPIPPAPAAVLAGRMRGPFMNSVD